MFSLNSVSNNKNFRHSSLCASFMKHPFGFVDVGAAGDVSPFILPVASLTHSICFEPEHKAAEELRRKNAGDTIFSKVTVLESAVGRRAGRKNLYVTESAVNSSLLKPRPELLSRYRASGFRIKKEIPVCIDSLDKLLSGTKAKGEFVKLDCQGLEYEVLRGARKVLKEQCVALVCEVEFTKMYEGQALFSEVDLFLRKNGFSLYGFYPHYISAKKLNRKEYDTQERLLWADAIYFKDPLEASGRGKLFSKRNSDALILAAILTHYYDYALELLDFFPIKRGDMGYLKRLICEMAAADKKVIESDFLDSCEHSRRIPRKRYLFAKKFIDAHVSNNDIDFIKL